MPIDPHEHVHPTWCLLLCRMYSQTHSSPYSCTVHADVLICTCNYQRSPEIHILASSTRKKFGGGEQEKVCVCIHIYIYTRIYVYIYKPIDIYTFMHISRSSTHVYRRLQMGTLTCCSYYCNSSLHTASNHLVCISSSFHVFHTAT